MQDAMRHAQEEIAARILAAAKEGKPLAAVARENGTLARPFSPTTRQTPADGMPRELVGPLFTLKPGELTMVETGTSFVVAQLDQIIDPDIASDADGFAKIRADMVKAVSDDVEMLFLSALRNQANPKINRAQLDQLTQAE
jgi:hypothetical protein